LNETPVALPDISITHSVPNEGADYFLVIPASLKAISDALLAAHGKNKVSQMSTVRVVYKESDDGQQKEGEEAEDEFDDATQLYRAKQSCLLKNDSKDIPIYRLSTGSKTIDMFTCPIFQNKVTYNLLTNVILDSYVLSNMLVLATSELTGHGLLNKLISSRTYSRMTNPTSLQQEILESIPTLTPPAAITGISGSFASRATFMKVPCLTLVADAEGAFNLDMEQLNIDAAETLAINLSRFLSLDSSSKFIKEVKTRLELKRAGNSGLYV